MVPNTNSNDVECVTCRASLYPPSNYCMLYTTHTRLRTHTHTLFLIDISPLCLLVILTVAGDYCEFKASDHCDRPQTVTAAVAAVAFDPAFKLVAHGTQDEVPYCVNHGICHQVENSNEYYCKCVSVPGGSVWGGKRCEIKLGQSQSGEEDNNNYANWSGRGKFGIFLIAMTLLNGCLLAFNLCILRRSRWVQQRATTMQGDNNYRDHQINIAPPLEEEEERPKEGQQANNTGGDTTAELPTFHRPVKGGQGEKGVENVELV